MNGYKKFKEIYDKFGESYGNPIIEHIIIIQELENCHKLICQQTIRG